MVRSCELKQRRSRASKRAWSARCLGRLMIGAMWVCAPVLSSAQAPQPQPPGVVAVVNGEPITAAQWDAEIRGALTQFEDQLRRLRQTVLMKLIDTLLLEQAARKEGVSLDDYLRRHLEGVAVSDEEVEEAYQRSRNRFPRTLAPEAKHRIRRDLEDHRRADALRRLLERRRREATVESYLVDTAGAELAAGPAPWRGSTHAPVTIVECCDFPCPFCRRAQAVIGGVLAKWSPQVRLIFRHLPLPQHPPSLRGGQGGGVRRAAGAFLGAARGVVCRRAGLELARAGGGGAGGRLE